MRVGQCTARAHNPRSPGATPGPATVEYANWQSGQVESLAILWVRLPPRSLELIPWSKGEDACVTCRKVLVRVQPGSLEIGKRSVGVSAAHLRGKQEDRVQFPDRPLKDTHGLLVLGEDT